MNYLTAEGAYYEPLHKIPMRTRSPSPTGLSTSMRCSREEMKIRQETPTKKHDEASCCRKSCVRSRREGMRATSTPVSSPKSVLIEISPGVQAQLRGSEETWQAILDGGYAPVLCLSCNTSLFAVQNCSFVLCPLCRVISPMDAADNKREAVGMGFTFDDLVKWNRAAEFDRQKRYWLSKNKTRDDEKDADRWRTIDRPNKDLRCPQRNRSGDLDVYRKSLTR